MSEQPTRPSWRYRRRVIFGCLYASVAGLAFLLLAAGALALLGLFTPWVASFFTVAFCAVIALAVMIVGSYVFGAVWDDKNFMAALGRSRGEGQPDHEGR